MKFEKGGARQEGLTYSQAAAFIKTALDFGNRGIMPAERCLHLAIGTAAQFEMMLRQTVMLQRRDGRQQLAACALLRPLADDIRLRFATSGAGTRARSSRLADARAAMRKADGGENG